MCMAIDFGELLSFGGFRRKNTQSPINTQVPQATPATTQVPPAEINNSPKAAQAPGALTAEAVLHGVTDPVTGEVRRADKSWTGPGITQDDRRLMGDPRASSPGGQMLDARKTGVQSTESPMVAPAISSSPESPVVAPAVAPTSTVETTPVPEPITAPEAPPASVIPFPKTPEEPAAA